MNIITKCLQALLKELVVKLYFIIIIIHQQWEEEKKEYRFLIKPIQKPNLLSNYSKPVLTVHIFMLQCSFIKSFSGETYYKEEKQENF